MNRCRICGNQEHNSDYRAREMMLGLRHQFDYFQCAACDCLQIVAFPADMTPYYPPHYVGFGKLRVGNIALPGWSVTMGHVPDMLAERSAMQAAETSTPGTNEEADEAYAKILAERAVARYLPDLTTQRHARILDVGCGDGEFIHTLHEVGFTNVMGVDLYIGHDIDYENGVKVRKGTIHDVEPTWDVIMLHHTLEHVSNPLETLQAAAQCLSPQGVCLIRIPIVSSYAWEHYRTHWIQLDAPRHFFLHSLQSLDILARQAGLRLDNTLYDSLPGALAISEMYQRDIALTEANPGELFSAEEIQAFVEHTERLNQEKRGDQAAFYLVQAAR